MARAAKNTIRLELRGADELSNTLREVDIFFRGTVVQKAVKKAARVLVSPLRRATPKSKKKFGKQAAKNPPGTTRKSTGVVFRKYKYGGIQAAYVGHRWPKGAAAHLIDQGTADRFRKNRKRGYTGHIEGRKFFKAAVDPLRTTVQATMRRELRLGIEEAKHKAGLKALKKAAK